MRIAFGAFLAFLAQSIVPSAAVGAEPPLSKTIAGWTATCDNLRNCVVIGSSDDGDGLFYVRVARGAAEAAEPKVKVVLAASDPIPGAPGAFQLSAGAGTRKTSDAYAVAARKDDPDGAALAAEIADPAFLTSLETAETLDYVAGTLKGRLLVKGLVPALRFVDVHQGRAGTSSALVARGDALRQVSPLPVPPVVLAAGVAAAAVASPTLGRALLDMAKPACDPEVVEAHSDTAAWMLGPDHQLVAVPCAEGAYNISVALFTTDAKGGQPRPAMLEQPPKQGDAAVDNVVVNYELKEKTLTLTSLDKGRGLGDCGSSRTWIWTGEIFALLQATELEACPGALPEDWPPIYQAVRK